MATRKKAASTARATTTTATAARPAATAAATLPRRPAKPPLERALDAITVELRAELTKAQSDIATLRAELAALRKRYDAHTHAYTHASPGSGASQWFDLAFLRNYLGGADTTHDGHGVYWRGAPASGGTPPRTEPPPP